MNPIVLAPNQAPKFYRGGNAIAAFRGLDGEHPRRRQVPKTGSLARRPAGCAGQSSGHALRRWFHRLAA